MQSTEHHRWMQDLPIFTKDKKYTVYVNETGGLFTSWNKQVQRWSEKENAKMQNSAKARSPELIFNRDKIKHPDVCRIKDEAFMWGPEAWAYVDQKQIHTSCLYMYRHPDQAPGQR